MFIRSTGWDIGCGNAGCGDSSRRDEMTKTMPATEMAEVMKSSRIKLCVNNQTDWQQQDIYENISNISKTSLSPGQPDELFPSWVAWPSDDRFWMLGTEHWIPLTTLATRLIQFCGGKSSYFWWKSFIFWWKSLVFLLEMERPVSTWKKDDDDDFKATWAARCLPRP